MRRVSRCWSSGWRPMSKPCSVTLRDEASAMTSEAAVTFRAAHAAGGAWQPVVRRCLDALGHLPADANLGFVYVTDDLADHLPRLVGLLRKGGWVAVGGGRRAPLVETRRRAARG